MRVAIRVDASATIGTGHLHRCLALADALARHGATVRFVSRPHDAVAPLILNRPDAETRWLPSGLSDPGAATGHAAWAGASETQDAADTIEALVDFAPDWVVIDHYALGAEWHQAVRRGLGCRLMAIEDLGDRVLDVDILHDGNFSLDLAAKYAGRAPVTARRLLGPRHALLSAIYRQAPRLTVRPEVRSIGVFMGGTDPGGASAKVLTVLRTAVGFTGPIEVVSTSANPHLDGLKAACAADAAVTLSMDLPNLAGFYGRHDLQIGAGGSASYERCCIGAPTVALVLAENQLVVAPGLAAEGVIAVARTASIPTTALLPDAPDLAESVRALLRDEGRRRELSARSLVLVDGRGAERAALALTAPLLQLRPARLDDGAMLHGWRNHPTVRSVSIDGSEIPLERHLAWLDARLQRAEPRLFVAQIGPTPVGCIRFDPLEEPDRFEVSLYMDPDLSGLGLGPEMLLAAERTLSDAVTVVATVLPGNTASERLFTHCGYEGGPLHFEKRLSPEEATP